MAEGKKSFLIYCDIIHSIDHLTNEEKGVLFQHLLEYVNDMNPELKDRVLVSAWKPIEMQLKRDLKKYENICNRNSENARKRWDKKNTTASDRIPPHTKNADTDTDIDTDINNNKGVDEVLNLYIKQISGSENQIWREAFYMRMKYKPRSLKHIIDEFVLDFKLRDHRKPKTLKDFKKHLTNWVNTQERLDKFDKYKIKSNKSLAI